MKIGWFGVGLGVLSDPEGVVATVDAAEQLGYESLWVGEHPVLVDPRVPPSPLPPDARLLDPIAVLSFAAAASQRIRLGTGILLLPLRNPVILAKQLASVDVLSQGRLIAGIGVGYVRGEYEAVGVPFETRGKRADEYIDALRALWRDAHPRCDGETVAFNGVQSHPRPVQPGGIPIVMSGVSRPALRRAVTRGNGWYGYFVDVESAAAVLDELRILEEEHGRPAELGRLEITITPRGEIGLDDVRRYQALGVDRLVILRDFRDAGGRNDPTERAAIVEAMRQRAAALGLG